MDQNEANDVPQLATQSLVSLGDDKCVFLAEMCVFLASPPYQGQTKDTHVDVDF